MRSQLLVHLLLRNAFVCGVVHAHFDVKCFEEEDETARWCVAQEEIALFAVELDARLA